MKEHKNKITLNKNSRGCYILDTIKGCSSCIKINRNGCYDECYAKRISDRYGFDFSKSIKRDFNNDIKQLWFFGLKDKTHTNDIIKKIKLSTMPFIRIGEMGDPSEDWEHTIGICEAISVVKKPIVIITKHWNLLSEEQLKRISKMNICINTSISALDDNEQGYQRLNQFYRLKNICKSVLRIVSCDFNKNNKEGIERAFIQDELFKNTPNIDTVFRCSQKNKFVINKIINIKRVKFLNKFVFASVFNNKTYFGFCKNCPEMCGIYK